MSVVGARVGCARMTVLVGVAAVAGVGSAEASTAYRVRAGDSLSSIALAHGTTVSALARLNHLAPNGVLVAGVAIVLPGPAVRIVRYRVRLGDTLTGIAERFHTGLERLARANQMNLSETLRSGVVLRVPTRARPARGGAGREGYTVRAGDTLASIATRYGVSLGALADLNGMELSDVLQTGRRLRIPTKTLPDSTVRASILFWARHYGVDPRLIAALAWMESGFNNTLVSPTGAQGVMQIEPATWHYVEQVLLLGETVPHDADGNIRIGTAYLHHLLHLYNGNEKNALAAYYQGVRALTKQGFLPGTEQYVDDILALKTRTAP